MNKKSDRRFFLVISGLLSITFLVISKNLLMPYLWFDEAVQFWVSKGLNPDSSPLAHPNGWLEVIENNKYYNMDPGGFGILLHFWSLVSNYHVWLRLLPFVFFIGIVLSFIYLSYLWLKNINIAILTGFIPILFPVILGTGFEIRAFSMESFGTLLGIIALEKLKYNISLKHLFLWSCIFCFFITSRYSEIIVVMVISIYVLYLIFHSESTLNQKLLFSLIYSIPLLTTLIYIYFFALIFQNNNLEPLSYLPYISNNKSILFEPENIIFIFLIILLLIIFFFKDNYLLVKKYELLLFITITVNGIFIILSILGKHPWDPYSNRCVSLFILMLLCFTAFLGELMLYAFKIQGILIYYFFIVILIFTLYLRKNSLFVGPSNINTYSNFQNIGIEHYNRIYVDYYASPYVRYLFEYGNDTKLNKETIYPGHFTFAKYGHHDFLKSKVSKMLERRMKQPKMNDLTQYDLLIAPVLSQQGNNNKWKLIEGTTNFYTQTKSN